MKRHYIFGFLLILITFSSFAQTHQCELLYISFDQEKYADEKLNYNLTDENLYFDLGHNGSVNGSGYFNQSKITIDNNKPLLTTKQFTIAFWAKINGNSYFWDDAWGQAKIGDQPVFIQRDSYAVGDTIETIGFELNRHNNARMYVRDSTDQAVSIVTTPMVEDDFWHHYAGVLSDDGKLSIYIDGELKNQVDYTPRSNFRNTNTTFIGHHMFEQHEEIFSYQSYQSLNASLDEFRIFNCGLSSDEVHSLYEDDHLTFLSNLKENAKNQFYPNPTQNTLHFSEKALSGEIMNVQGQVLFTFQKSKKIDVSQLETGTYFIKTEDGISNFLKQ